MKHQSILILFLLSSLTLFSFPHITVVQAQDMIYIRADGNVEGTEMIQRNGNFYTFLNDINGSIIIEKDDIVVNGADYYLHGAGIWNTTGIVLLSRKNVSIRNLKITGFREGIVLRNSKKNSIFGNKIINNEYGIYLDSFSNNNSINENQVLMNSNTGIYIFNSSNNTIVKNIIEKNAEFGIILIYSSNNNVVYHNSFISNYIQVFASDSVDFWDVTPPPDSMNIWDNGYHSGGNFWSDYVYVDNYKGLNQNQTGSDGIWDYPYVIDPLNKDNYPLMGPIIISEFPSWIILPIFVAVTITGLICRRRLSKNGELS